MPTDLNRVQKNPLMQFQNQNCDLNSRKHHLESYSVVSKKDICNFLKKLLKSFSPFQLCICVRTDLPHTLQLKQYIPTD